MLASHEQKLADEGPFKRGSKNVSVLRLPLKISSLYLSFFIVVGVLVYTYVYVFCIERLVYVSKLHLNPIPLPLPCLTYTVKDLSCIHHKHSTLYQTKRYTRIRSGEVLSQLLHTLHTMVVYNFSDPCVRGSCGRILI